MSEGRRVSIKEGGREGGSILNQMLVFGYS